jgi:hypothetical protein
MSNGYDIGVFIWPDYYWFPTYDYSFVFSDFILIVSALSRS